MNNIDKIYKLTQDTKKLNSQLQPVVEGFNQEWSSRGYEKVGGEFSLTRTLAWLDHLDPCLVFKQEVEWYGDFDVVYTKLPLLYIENPNKFKQRHEQRINSQKDPDKKATDQQRLAWLQEYFADKSELCKEFEDEIQERIQKREKRRANRSDIL